MNKKIYSLSIRAMTFIGVICLRRYCNKNNIDDPDIEAFCNQMELLAIAENLPKWDSDSNKINITGMGDKLPDSLIKNYKIFEYDLHRIIESIREISASQMYGSCGHHISYENLMKVLECTRIKTYEINLHVFLTHQKNNTGWGNPIREDELNIWRNNL